MKKFASPRVPDLVLNPTLYFLTRIVQKTKKIQCFKSGVFPDPVQIFFSVLDPDPDESGFFFKDPDIIKDRIRISHLTSYWDLNDVFD